MCSSPWVLVVHLRNIESAQVRRLMCVLIRMQIAISRPNDWRHEGFFFVVVFFPPRRSLFLFFMMRSVHDETGFVAYNRDTGAGMERVCTSADLRGGFT